MELNKNIDYIWRMLFEIFCWMLWRLEIDIFVGFGAYCITICWALLASYTVFAVLVRKEFAEISAKW